MSLKWKQAILVSYSDCIAIFVLHSMVNRSRLRFPTCEGPAFPRRSPPSCRIAPCDALHTPQWIVATIYCTHRTYVP